MIFSQYWSKLKVSNKALETEDLQMKITVKSFKKQLEKAFNAGKQKSVSEAAKDFENLGKKDPMKDFSDLFGGGLFG